MPSLTVLRGHNQGANFPLKGERILLGRNQDCHIVINVPAVSREHAIIHYIEGQFYIEDLNSRNHTFVNNQQISDRKLLHHEDKIKICDNVFVFKDNVERPPLPAEMLPESRLLMEEEEESPVGYEATINQSSRQILETQPAEKLALLLQIASDLLQSLDLDQIFPKIVNTLFQVFKQADRSFVIFSDDEGNKLVPKVIRTRRTHEETTARFSRTIVRNCLESKAALLSENASADKRFDLSQSIADCRIRSVMCAPLMGRSSQTAFGVIQLDTQDRAKRFTEEDLKFLAAVAGQAAVALENAQLHQSVLSQAKIERELRLARDVQINFLPDNPPKVSGYEFFAYYESALDVGGDYYDFIPIPGEKIAVTIGDVAGKGVPAALLMAKVSSDTRFLMLTETGPAEAITRLNEFMQQTGLVDRFITLETAVINPETHEVQIVNAGHMAPIWYRHSTGEFVEALDREEGGLPLGVLEQYSYDAYSIQLDPGDVIVMFSDGVTESPNKDQVEFQTERVFAALQSGECSPQAMVERLVAALKLHSQGCTQHDDITVVAFGRTV